jgi:2,4-dienoyl-CoA reductase-like NADH-dependent reductase (Old Yellow Enzyme family)
MAVLSDPIALPCGASLKNRIAKAAMTEGLADCYLRATGRHAQLYETWGKSGAGLLITGNVMVDRRHLEAPGNVAIEDRLGVRQLEAWAKAGTAQGAHLWMQINHPGRQTPNYVGLAPVSASDVKLDLGGMFNRPRALKEPEIEDIINRFGFVARVAQETGFTGVQIHAAHGYLIGQFLSPVTNRRQDHFGGTLKNRAHLLLEIVRNVRATVGPSFPISVKLNSADFQKGGFSAQDCVQVVQWLVAEGIDLLEISGGTYEQPKMFDLSGAKSGYLEPQTAGTAAREAHFLVYTQQIRAVCPIPLMITGGFRTPDAMNTALGDGSVDVIGLARPFCVDPDLGHSLLEGHMAPKHERDLRLGQWRFLGPQSPIRFIKMLNGFGQLAWYAAQIDLLAQGQAPNPDLTLFSTLVAQQRGERAKAEAIRHLAR